MTPDFEHWDRLQALFHLAEASPDRDLDELLREATDDADLRARARTLIEAGRRAQSPELPGAPLLPDKVGPYTILKHLGTGGIGSVYLVERTVGGATQRAALKMLSRSAGGAFFAERFAREQYILASLQHEHITRMLDAGVSDQGQAYLVMEYVDGQHLDRYCDERQLGVEPRLRLFLEVCEAIRYAHQNLVVHLDLKPSNILVASESGAIKVLDFGTSKLIAPDSLLTTTVMATPAYASPEQLLNEPVTTVCDVYALGAILFELLSGRRPNQDFSVAALIERSMKEFPPEPLTGNLTEAAAQQRGLTQTRLRSLLTGDLATIVTKCLNPRPKDRYTTVDALIDDVHRYLAGRPIHARTQTTTYRLGKFVRRHRASVVAASIGLLTLTAALGYAAWRQQQAVVAGRRAIAMQTFMQTVFELANPDHTGKPVTTVPELLQIGQSVLPSLIQNSADRRAAQLSLAESMNSNGDFADAERALIALVEDAKRASDLPVEGQAEARLGDVEDTLGKSKLGLDLTAHALSLAHARGISHYATIEITSLYAHTREDDGIYEPANLTMLADNVVDAQRYNLPAPDVALQAVRYGSALQSRGRVDDADTFFKQALALYQQTPYSTCDQGKIYRFLGESRAGAQQYQASLDLFQKADEVLRQCSGDSSLSTLTVESYIANALVRLDRSAEAIPLLLAVLPRYRKAVGPDSMNLVAPLLFLARAYNATGDFANAESTARELHALLARDTNPAIATVALTQQAWAIALAGQHRYPEALIHARLAASEYPPPVGTGTAVNFDKIKATLASIEEQSKLEP